MHGHGHIARQLTHVHDHVHVNVWPCLQRHPEWIATSITRCMHVRDPTRITRIALPIHQRMNAEAQSISWQAWNQSSGEMRCAKADCRCIRMQVWDPSSKEDIAWCDGQHWSCTHMSIWRDNMLQSNQAGSRNSMIREIDRRHFSPFTCTHITTANIFACPTWKPIYNRQTWADDKERMQSIPSMIETKTIANVRHLHHKRRNPVRPRRHDDRCELRWER